MRIKLILVIHISHLFEPRRRRRRCQVVEIFFLPSEAQNFHSIKLGYRWRNILSAAQQFKA